METGRHISDVSLIIRSASWCQQTKISLITSGWLCLRHPERERERERADSHQSNGNQRGTISLIGNNRRHRCNHRYTSAAPLPILISQIRQYQRIHAQLRQTHTQIEGGGEGMGERKRKRTILALIFGAELYHSTANSNNGTKVIAIVCFLLLLLLLLLLHLPLLLVSISFVDYQFFSTSSSACSLFSSSLWKLRCLISFYVYEGCVYSLVQSIGIRRRRKCNSYHLLVPDFFFLFALFFVVAWNGECARGDHVIISI